MKYININKRLLDVWESVVLHKISAACWGEVYYLQSLPRMKKPFPFITPFAYTFLQFDVSYNYKTRSYDTYFPAIHFPPGVTYSTPQASL